MSSGELPAKPVLSGLSKLPSSSEEGSFAPLVMGLSDRYRLLVVRYTEVDDKTRILSARQATRTERRSYEEK
jgi:uncharacterized DUF497 family protein